MTQYRVMWEIDIEADTPEEAAREAQITHRDAFSEANCFDVEDQATGLTVFVNLDGE
jgi:hypothetical protein